MATGGDEMKKAAEKKEEAEKDDLKGDFLQCPICREELVQDKMLPCGHTFCLACLKQYARSQTRIYTGATFPCAICRKEAMIPSGGVEGFPNNFLLQNLKEKLGENAAGLLQSEKETASFVQRDSSPNKRRTKQHNQHAANKGVLFETRDKWLPTCPEHPQQLGIYYCDTCKDTFCYFCYLNGSKHATHMFRAHGSGYNRSAEKLVDSRIARVKSRLTNYMHAHVKNLENLNVALSDLETLEQKICDEVESRAEELVQAIIQQKEDILKTVNTVCSSLHQTYTRNSNQTEEELNSLKDDMEVASRIYVRHNILDIDQVSKFEDVMARLDERHTKGPRKVLPKLKMEFQYNIESIDDAASEALGFIHHHEVMGEITRTIDITHLQATGLSVMDNDDTVVASKRNAISSFLWNTKAGLNIFDPLGNPKRNIQTGNDVSPFDVHVHEGDIYVYDAKNGAIRVYSGAGSEKGCWKMRLSGEGGIAMDLDGTCYVSSPDDRCIYKCTHEGDKKIFVSSNQSPVLKGPKSVAVGPTGNVYVVDTPCNAVHAWSKEGNYLFSYGRRGKEDSCFQSPEGVTVDSFGNILVADFLNNRIHLLSPEGKFGGYVARDEDQLHSPWAIAVNKNGEVLVIEGLVRSFSVKAFKYIVGYE